MEEDKILIEYVKEEVEEKQQKPQGTAKGTSGKKAERKGGFKRARVWHLDHLWTKTRNGRRYWKQNTKSKI